MLKPGDIISAEIKHINGTIEWVETCVYLGEANGRIQLICEGGWERGLPSNRVETWTKDEDATNP